MWEKWERRRAGSRYQERAQPKSSGIVLFFFYSEGEGICCDVGAMLNTGCNRILIIFFLSFFLLPDQADLALLVTEGVKSPFSLLFSPLGFDGIK